MRSEKQVESDFSELVDAVKMVEGVIGIILFGSAARGEADEGSDLDLLVFFEDEEKMRRGEWEVTRRVPPETFAQSICLCPSTIAQTNPTFLESVLEEGIILYMQYPLTLKVHQANTEPSSLVTYSLEGLSQKEKQTIDYKLFGRRVGKHHYLGLIDKRGGKRLGKGCVIVPRAGVETVLAVLREHNAKHSVMQVYVPAGTNKFLSAPLSKPNVRSSFF